ncbi:hypothetical protein [Nannocystis pusilla]|uniref:hypothetical protein n=1 Tax=Nannocystis pusilla TaxID=889268 RepID=UPI003B7D0AA1
MEIGWSQNAVAKAYGVDHTTVMHAVGSAPDDLRLVVGLIAVRLSQEAQEGTE